MVFFLQDFIQAVLLTSVFHKRLSLWLYTITQCASVRWPLQLGVQGSAVSPLGGSGAKPLEADYFSNSRFSNSLSMNHSVT